VLDDLEGRDRSRGDGVGVHTRQGRPELIGVVPAAVVLLDGVPSEPGDKHVAVEAHLHLLATA
jgi:hypothetical protein